MNNPKFLKSINPESVYHLEADVNYTILNLKNGSKFISSYSLKVFEDIFDERLFIRIDRSNLVNHEFIAGTSMRDGSEYICLKNNIEFLIPRRRKAILFSQYPNLFTHLQTTLQS